MASDTANNAVTTTPVCPLGEAQCPVIDEVMQLRQQVLTDPLTGLYNVRHFTAALEQELERTERTGIATALMMIDLDHFKRINDQWGHEVGNRVLRGTAACIRENTRRLDVQCRYGGEEFAVILPSTERRLAIQVAERVRLALQDAMFYVDDDSDQTIDVTASIGIAWHGMDQWHSQQSLVEEADQYLYQAKQQGRNRVCYADQDAHAVTVSQGEKALLHDLFVDEDSPDDASFDAGDEAEWDFDGQGS
ncbi:GGDEF domain-containing protein [Bacterioplanes sanyensis]|uniref:diguanylate cyclase n=2 Tax=Bacterioplanes sanyensis TaxID=1249553 RepID=A0A222FJJ0_9GAMM|nr:GGDEF domain-containing protein [Bacterioplanes sanyensis]